jgi:hypothetical protein
MLHSPHIKDLVDFDCIADSWVMIIRLASKFSPMDDDACILVALFIMQLLWLK